MTPVDFGVLFLLALLAYWIVELTGALEDLPQYRRLLAGLVRLCVAPFRIAFRVIRYVGLWIIDRRPEPEGASRP